MKDTNDNRLQEMGEILRLAAEPYRAHDNAKSRIARAAMVLQISWRRAYSLWYGEEKTRVWDAEAKRLRAERDRLLRLRLARLEAEIIELRKLIDDQERQNALAGSINAVDCGSSISIGPVATT